MNPLYTFGQDLQELRQCMLSHVEEPVFGKYSEEQQSYIDRVFERVPEAFVGKKGLYTKEICREIHKITLELSDEEFEYKKRKEEMSVAHIKVQCALLKCAESKMYLAEDEEDIGRKPINTIKRI